MNKKFTLSPLKKGLSKDEVWALYQEGRLYVKNNANEEVQRLMRQVISRVSRCSSLLASGKTMMDIIMYFQTLFGGDDVDCIMERMYNPRTRRGFMCEQVGILMENGTFFGETNDAAKLLNFKGIKLDSTKRYIREGKEKYKKSLRETIQSV